MKPAVTDDGKCRFYGYKSICEKCRTSDRFRESIAAPVACSHRWKLGDIVAAIATPIARVLKLDCIDPATNDLKPESGCAKRKARLNGEPTSGS